MIKPIGDRVLVQPVDPEENTSGGIDLSKEENEEETKEWGEIITVGDGDGVKRFKKGDILVFQKYGPARVKLGHDLFVIVHLEEIYGVKK